MALELGSRRQPTTRPFITSSTSCNSKYQETTKIVIYSPFFLLFLLTVLPIVPFDEHRFSKIFMKLYNKMFTMEEYKYLPPKYSFALKDLAIDFGVFERADVSSMVSGSTNMSVTNTSGFNVNFNDNSLLKE